jgi:hypothetical protein
MIKQIKFLLIAAGFVSCGKVIEYSNSYSTATFINASPGSPALSVLVDSINQTGTALVYRAASLPLNIQPGVRNVLIRSNNPLVPGAFLYPVKLMGQEFAENKSATFINYDTLSTSVNYKVVRLTDDLAPAPSGFIKVRYISVATSTPASDITFLRTSVNGVSLTTLDSVTINNQSYIGASPSAQQIEALSKFIQLPAGNYTVKQKTAGTQTVIATATLSTLFGGINTGAFTVYSTGGVQSLPLTIIAVRHYP